MHDSHDNRYACAIANKECIDFPGGHQHLKRNDQGRVTFIESFSGFLALMFASFALFESFPSFDC